MKILEFVKKMFFVGLTILTGFTNANSLSCISMNNHECKARPQLVNVNGDEAVFFPFSIEASKYSGSCNNINYPYAKACVPDVAEDLNVKVFNLMLRINETRFIKWHELKMKIVKNMSANLGLMFLIINNVGIKVNADVNVKY